MPSAPWHQAEAKPGRSLELPAIPECLRSGQLPSWSSKSAVLVGESAASRLEEFVPAGRRVELEQGQADPRGAMGQAGQRLRGRARSRRGIRLPRAGLGIAPGAPAQILAELDRQLPTRLEAGRTGQGQQRGIALRRRRSPRADGVRQPPPRPDRGAPGSGSRPRLGRSAPRASTRHRPPRAPRGRARAGSLCPTTA